MIILKGMLNLLCMMNLLLLICDDNGDDDIDGELHKACEYDRGRQPPNWEGGPVHFIGRTMGVYLIYGNSERRVATPISLGEIRWLFDDISICIMIGDSFTSFTCSLFVDIGFV